MNKNLINLSSDISKSCAFRGGILPSLISKDVTRTFSRVSSISFSIHCNTHIDLPWTLDWNKIREYLFELKSYEKSTELSSRENKRLLDLISFFEEIGLNENNLDSIANELSINRTEIENKYFSWIEKKCVILDFSNKIDILEEFLDKNNPFPSLFLRDIDKIEAFFLFNQLKITRNDLEKKLNLLKNELGHRYPKDGLKNKILIFKTLWTERFLPYKMDINNPIFESWHAFLTYPYLTRDAILFLIEEGVDGLASDTVSLENPLTYVDFLSDNYKNYLQNLEDFEVGFFPLHFSFLGRQKIIIENLWNLLNVDFNIGTIYIFPYKLGSSDGTIANIFVKP